MGKRLLLLLVGLVLAGYSQVSLAQGQLDQIYSAEDEPFSFFYPAIYDLQVLESGVVELSGNTSSTLIYGPAVLAASGYDAVNAEAVIAQIIADLPDVTPGEITPIEVGDNTALKLTYRNADNKIGTLLVVRLPDNMLAAMNTRWNRSSVLTGTDNMLNRLAGTMLNEARDESSLPTPTPRPTPRPTATPDPNSEPEPPKRLTSDMADWQAVVAELEESGFIPSGGQLVFQEDYAFFSGQGRWYTPLAENTSHDDIVVAGLLDFQYSGGGDELDSCTLLARIHTEGNAAIDFLEVGIDANGWLFMVDNNTIDDPDVHVVEQLSIDEAHQILFIAHDTTIAIYIDNTLSTEEELTETRSGSFGISLVSSIPDAQCTGYDIWAYSLPHVIPGECHVEVTGSINQRQGPSTSTEIAGQLTDSEHPEVTGQTTGENGFVWWQLEDDSWVRSDVVRVVGDCQAIPDVSTP